LSDTIQIDAECIEVEQRDAIFGRSGNGDIARLDRAARNQLRDEAGFLFDCSLQCSMHAGLIDHAILNQALGQATQAGS
jgi:hypothetical protein